jgi:hypothetical protein
MSLRPLHRARRFGRSLVARAPSERDTAWAHGFLSDPEQRLFDRMAAVDRSHSIGVARAVASNLDRLDLAESDPQARWILVAALTHDVGKTVAGLGTYGRVVATLSEAAGGASMANVWATRRGMTRRVGLYLQYPGLGADLLAVAGSDERVVAWAAQHHEPEESWTVPADAGRLLVAADDEEL